MNAQLCLTCAEWAFSRWRGWCSFGTERWRDKPDLPDVPLLEGGKPCSRCAGTTTVRVEQVYYHNIHGEYNTGLPDYFVLEIHSSDTSDMRRWGSPFADPWIVDRIPVAELEAHMLTSRYRKL